MERRTFLRFSAISLAAISTGCVSKNIEPENTPEHTPEHTTTQETTPAPSLTAVTQPTPTPTEPVEPTAPKESAEVWINESILENVYIDGLAGITKVLEAPIDPKISGVVESMFTTPEGDLTNTIIRSLPVDDKWPNSWSLRFQLDFLPPDELVELTNEYTIPVFSHNNGVQTLSRLAADKLKNWIVNFSSSNIYVSYGFRDANLQYQLHQVNPSGAASGGGSEHQTGLAVDLLGARNSQVSVPRTFRDMRHEYGWVISNGANFDPAHYFCLDAATGINGLTSVLVKNNIQVDNHYAVREVLAKNCQLLYLTTASQKHFTEKDRVM